MRYLCILFMVVLTTITGCKPKGLASDDHHADSTVAAVDTVKPKVTETPVAANQTESFDYKAAYTIADTLKAGTAEMYDGAFTGIANENLTLVLDCIQANGAVMVDKGSLNETIKDPKDGQEMVIYNDLNAIPVPINKGWANLPMTVPEGGQMAENFICLFVTLNQQGKNYRGVLAWRTPAGEPTADALTKAKETVYVCGSALQPGVKTRLCK